MLNSNEVLHPVVLCHILLLAPCLVLKAGFFLQACGSISKSHVWSMSLASDVVIFVKSKSSGLFPTLKAMEVASAVSCFIIEIHFLLYNIFTVSKLLIFANFFYIQAKFNLFVSKLCLNSDAAKYLFLNAYKEKMGHILEATPDISLYKDEDLPPHLREVAILTGYRSPTCSVKECALSVFIATNETLNFWTHFLPTFYFVYQLLTFWDDLGVFSDSYYWPLIIYMFTICLYPLISALAHTFCTTSDMARHVWFFLDYGGLSLYSYGSGLLIKAYSFPVELQNTYMGEYFLEVLVFLSIVCSILACFSRFVDSLFWVKVFRLGAFFLPWIWDSIPVIYRLNVSTDIEVTVSEQYTLQFFFSFCISFFYASHLPEILAPGKFDFIGNSHQLLHICGIMATHYQMNAAVIDMMKRRELMQTIYPLPEYWALHVFSLVFFSIIVTIVIFILVARHHERNKQELKRDN